MGEEWAVRPVFEVIAFVQLSASLSHAFHLFPPLFTLVFGCLPSHVLKLCSLAATVRLSAQGVPLRIITAFNGSLQVLTRLLKAMGLAKWGVGWLVHCEINKLLILVLVLYIASKQQIPFVGHTYSWLSCLKKWVRTYYTRQYSQRPFTMLRCH